MGPILGNPESARHGTTASAEAREERGEGLLVAIVSSSDDAIISKDLNGIVTSWNPGAERLFGFDAEDMLGTSVLRIIPSELHEEEMRILALVRAGQRIEHYETVRMRKDGSRVSVSLTVSPIRDDSGAVVGASKIARDIGGLRERERAHAVLAAIVESSDDAIISKSLDGTITSWNKAAERLYGWKPAEIVGRSVLTIVPPELHDEEHQILRRLRAGERIDHFRTQRLAKDGRRVDVALTISPIRDGSGAIVGASKVARDVSRERDAERTRAILAAVVQSSDDAIVSKDLRGIVMSWNPAAERMFGWKSEEMIGRSILTIIPPELRHEEDTILGNVRAGRRMEHYETVRVAKDGQRVHVSLTVSPLRDGTGRVVGASKVARDVTQQRESDRARGMLAAIVESSHDAIVSKNLSGMVTSWNRGAERVFGYTAEEMVGSSILRLIPPELQAEEYGILARIRAGERVEHFDTVRVAKGGRRIDVSITVSPVRDAGGNVVGASKIARDVTEIREAQRRKDEFLAILAHELRNPLAPVRYAIAMLRQEGVSAEQRQRSEAILERQADHMARLLDDLLDVSRIATGKVDLKKARVELRPLVQNAVDAVRVVMDEKRHRLEVRLADVPMWLDADPVRISQILVNLLTNAAKYTDPGGWIQLITAREEDEAVIRVKDNGMGFAPEMKGRLFTLFTQLEPVLNRSAGGLGIGLALVREFVQRHGGTVEAHSEGQGKGSEFTVRLPCAAAPPR
ncbi:MAG TPA: PAS domain-containing sensor histidine kinase [Usitatibacter sp.]|jgi:PAS domain S-box-containing protein|nr:PAS domain-containing sensor histidine kinase [Usitatibacter sp.]